MNSYRIAVLAGINQGEYAHREQEQCEEFSKKDRTRKFRTDEKLSHRLANGESVLENTIRTLLTCSPDVSVIGDPQFLGRNTTSSYTLVPQQGESQLESIEQAIQHLYKNGYQGKSIIICGDVPCITEQDINLFISKAEEKNADVVMGVSDIDELRAMGVLNKRGIRAYDSAYEFDRVNPKLAYGNIFLTTKNVYERFDDVKDALDDALEMKKFVREPENYHKILNYLKDEGKTIRHVPKTQLGLAIDSILYSTPLRKMLLRNYLGGARSKKSISIPQLEKIAQSKLFGDVISFALSYSSPRLAIDVDDERDAEIANQFLEK